MLSSENPPQDTPCSSNTSQLKSSTSNISSDERDCDNYNQNQFEVDLFKSGGLDNHNPLPKLFSIRDYVFNTRGKHIENHWPFSVESLQLCLKHGVKDVLPPFQTLGSVRNQSIVKLEVAAENISNSVDHHLSLSSNNVSQKLASNIKSICKSSSSEEEEEDREYPSTTTSLSRSDDHVKSIPLIKSPHLEPPQAQISPRISLVGRPELAVPVASNNIQIKTPSSTKKKCRLILRLSNITDPKSDKDLSNFNASLLSEANMASKVCPVCKTFMSSSNTTLNAHIDQCLSGPESTIKCTGNSKVIKHRIKPRKTRLMVDIYTTALSSTLEDLDRRNGTNWVSNYLNFPQQDLELQHDEEKNNMTYSSANIEDKNDEGAVYFDSNGTKLRILSKSSDPQSNSNAKDDCGPRKLAKRGNIGSKLVSNKKKKYLVHRHKLQKCLPCVQQRSCSPRPDHRPEVINCQQRKFPHDGDEKEDLAQPLKDCDQMKSNDFGMIKQWVGSKRTGLKKKINLEHEHQHRDKIIKNLRVKSKLPLQADTRTSIYSCPISSDDYPLLTSESHNKNENLSSDSCDEYMREPGLRKRAGFSLFESQYSTYDKKNHLMLSKCNAKQSKEGRPNVDPPNGTENHAARSNKKMRSITPTKSSDISFLSSRMSSQHHMFSSRGKEFGSLQETSFSHAILSGGKKLTSLRKNLSSVRHASVSESKKNSGKKQLDFKKPTLLHYTPGSDDEIADQTASPRQDNLIAKLAKSPAQTDKASGKSLIDGSRVAKIRRGVGGFVDTGKRDSSSLKGSDARPESDGHGVEKHIGSIVGGDVPAVISNALDAVKEVQVRDGFVYEPISKMSGGEVLIAFGESLEFGFSALTSSKTHVAADINANEGQGNYFAGVDPIPIPGPPGSFLPSPGRMASGELQGNSSLTTCRMHSSEDEHGLMDMDYESDSPVSAARSDLISSVNLPVQSVHGVEHESQHEICEDDRMVPVVIPLEKACADGKSKLDDDELRANRIFPEISPHRFKNDQPCCCCRKEGVPQIGSLNYLESELLKSRRTMTSLSPPPSQEKHILRHDMYGKLYGFNLRPGTVTQNEPTSEPEKLVGSQSSEATFPTCGDRDESRSPSTPNSVLRLMGKNLIVLNKEENPSAQTRTTQSSMMDHPTLQSCVGNVVFSSKYAK